MSSTTRAARIRQRRAVLTAVVAMTVPTLAACQSSDPTGSNSSPRPDTSYTRSATAGALSKSGPGVRVHGAVSGASLDVVLEQAVQARAWVEQLWPQQVAAFGTVQIAIATTDAQFAALRGGAPGTDDLAASTTAEGTVILSETALQLLTAQGRRVVLAHELTHVVLKQTQRRGLPPWIVEGSAEYTAYRWAGLSLARACPTLRAQVHSGDIPSLPPTKDLFSGSSRQSAYQQAHAYMSFLIARFGLAAWKRFVISADGAAPGAFAKSFAGAAPAELQTAYSSYLRKVMG